MDWALPLYILLVFAGATVAPGVAYLAWRHRTAPGMGVLAAGLMAKAVWCLFDLFHLFASDPESARFWYQMQHLGSIALNPAAALLCYQLARRTNRIPLWLVLPMLLETAFSWLVMASNDRHGLFWSAITVDMSSFPSVLAERGLWGRVRIVYVAVVQLVGLAAIIMALPSASPYYRRQSVVPILSTIFGFFAMFLTYSGTSPLGSFDLTPAGLSCMTLVWAVVFMRGGVFTLTPVGRASLVEDLHHAVFVVDHRWRLADVNAEGLRLLGVRASEVYSKPVQQVLAHWPEVLALLRPSRERRTSCELTFGDRIFEFRVTDWRSLEGETVGHLISGQDITERREVEDRLQHMALHDALTGLPNRTMLLGSVREALRHSAAGNTKTAVLLIDLDRFKDVNDRLGHLAGDFVLREIAQRLRALMRPIDLAARFGGDEFVLLLVAIENVGAAEVLAEQVITSLERPMQVGDLEVSVGASVGIALGPDAGSDPATLLQHADEAMYAAKRSGGSRQWVYAPAGAPPAPVPAAFTFDR